MFIDRVAGRPDADAQEYPPWTIRCTWRVTDCRDEPFRTYHGAECESSAMERAVFVLDHYRRESADELICVDILQPGGRWANVPAAAALSARPCVAPQRSPGPAG
jgi:hypothetical protein